MLYNTCKRHRLNFFVTRKLEIGASMFVHELVHIGTCFDQTRRRYALENILHLCPKIASPANFFHLFSFSFSESLRIFHALLIVNNEDNYHDVLEEHIYEWVNSVHLSRCMQMSNLIVCEKLSGNN